MLPDPWSLAFALAVTSGVTQTAKGDDGLSGAPQADVTPLQAEEGADPTPPAEAPEAPPDEAPTQPPEAATTEPPSDGSTPAEGSPEPPADAPTDSGVASFPETDAETAEPTAPSTSEPRTWNDPTAAIAAAEANPNPAPPPEEDLGSEPLAPMPKKDPKGFGMAMVGAITFSPQSGHAWAEGGCPTASIDLGNGQQPVDYSPDCSATPAAGVSAEGRFGYMLGVVGFELYGQIATDYVNARLSDVPPIPGVPDYATQMHVGRIGIGGGGHVRLKTPPGSFRLSAGAGGGFLVRALFTNVSSLDGSSENYVAPVLRADVGIVLVNVVTLGVMGWLEFADTVTITPDVTSVLGAEAAPLQAALTNTVVMRGTQGFVGLFGGFAFGK